MTFLGCEKCCDLIYEYEQYITQKDINKVREKYFKHVEEEHTPVDIV